MHSTLLATRPPQLEAWSTHSVTLRGNRTLKLDWITTAPDTTTQTLVDSWAKILSA